MSQPVGYLDDLPGPTSGRTGDSHPVLAWCVLLLACCCYQAGFDAAEKFQLPVAGACLLQEDEG
jgi:hypothetical protein